MAQPNPPATTASETAKPKRETQPLPEDKFIKVGRCASTGREITLCYSTVGDPSNPCLLLVMGLGGVAWHWKAGFVDRLVKAGFYVIRYDNRDAGLSTHMDGCPTAFIMRMVLPAWASLGEGYPPYTLNDMADDGMNLLTALGIQKAHIFGASMGGMIVQCMALRHRERVQSLSIVYAHTAGPHVKPQTLGITLSMLKQPASNSLEDVVDFKTENGKLYAGGYPYDEVLFRQIAELTQRRCPEDKDGVLRQIWAIQRAENREPALEQMKGMPTLIIHGMVDTTVPFENGLQLARVIEDSKLVTFAKMGHSIPAALYDDIVAEVALLRQRAEALTSAA